MTAIGMYRNASTSATQTPSAVRVARDSITIPSQRLEGAEAARDQEVDPHDKDGDNRKGGAERQVARAVDRVVDDVADELRRRAADQHRRDVVAERQRE